MTYQNENTNIPLPTSPQNYIGNQIILNSDRLVFNAKTNNILFFSNKSIGFSTNQNIHFDTDNGRNSNSKFIISSPKIYIGMVGDDEEKELPTEPAVLGDKLDIVLNSIVDGMEKIYYDIATKVKLLVVKEGLPTSNHPDNMNLMLDRKSEDLKDIRDEIASIKSLITKIA